MPLRSSSMDGRSGIFGKFGRSGMDGISGRDGMLGKDSISGMESFHDDWTASSLAPACDFGLGGSDLRRRLESCASVRTLGMGSSSQRNVAANPREAP
jgi:hypothetical protein